MKRYMAPRGLFVAWEVKTRRGLILSPERADLDFEGVVHYVRAKGPAGLALCGRQVGVAMLAAKGSEVCAECRRRVDEPREGSGVGADRLRERY